MEPSQKQTNSITTRNMAKRKTVNYRHIHLSKEGANPNGKPPGKETTTKNTIQKDTAKNHEPKRMQQFQEIKEGAC